MGWGRAGGPRDREPLYTAFLCSECADSVVAVGILLSMERLQEALEVLWGLGRRIICSASSNF